MFDGHLKEIRNDNDKGMKKFKGRKIFPKFKNKMNVTKKI
jgi:hypothetical protein